MDVSPNTRVINGLGAAAATTHSKTGAQPANTGLPVLPLDPRTYDRALDCVHCGLCLPACPTYTQNGLEADSPRGRIYLMKGLADGRIQATDAVVEHLDLCLDCQACETACPSGVVYHELIEETRHKLQAARKQTLSDRLVNTMFFHVFPYPTRLRLAMLPARLLQRIGVWKPMLRAVSKLLPTKLDKMQQMLPNRGPLWEGALARKYPANPDACVDGKARKTVGLLAGCIGSVLFQDVNRQTIALLQHFGCDVYVPRSQTCCGAIHHHAGRHDPAVAFAKANIDALTPATSASENLNGDGVPELDHIVSNIAGCGAALKDYSRLLRDDPDYAARAKAFADKARDISEVLVELLPDDPDQAPKSRLRHDMPRTVTYHDACHLAHAQRVTDPPRQLLASIEGLEVIPLPESDMCCGAAGTYNLSQPDMARDLAERKIKHIHKTGARTCVTANVGCAMQIQSEADRLGVELHTTHPVTLLYEAHFGDNPPSTPGADAPNELT